jgi:cytidine deaminase
VTAAGTGVDTAIERAIDEVVARRGAGPLDGSTIPAADARRLVDQLGLGSATELALLALPLARRLARPPISRYEVAAVGIEAESGDLVLGGNLEFPGTDLGTTVHAEGFVTLRARRRGRTLATIALPSAHPCAHCRQVLSESAAADGLLLIDPEGSRVRLADLYPWPFRPGSLGVDGDAAGRVAWPSLALVGGAPPADVATALLAAGARAHAPYSAAPSAALLRTRDGRSFSAGCLESVAFNPSIGALQAALVELAAAGVDAEAVSEGWLGCTAEGAVDPEPGFRALLGAVAPGARVDVVRWRIGG